MHTVIGIDLAWSTKNLTGLAAGSVADNLIRITHLGHVKTNEQILDFVAEFATAPVTIAVDAPTITHPTGMRDCEKVLQRRFMKVHAGPYPGSTALLGKCNNGVPRGTELVRELGQRFDISEVGLPAEASKSFLATFSRF